MVFVPTIWDLGLWIVISAVLILLVSEVISPYYGKNNIILKTKNMRYIGIGLSILFFIIFVFRILVII